MRNKSGELIMTNEQIKLVQDSRSSILLASIFRSGCNHPKT
jgi:hypothetical protein